MSDSCLRESHRTPGTNPLVLRLSVVGMMVLLVGGRASGDVSISAENVSAFVDAVDKLGSNVGAHRRIGGAPVGIDSYQAACKPMLGCPGSCQYTSFPWGDTECALSPTQERLLAEVKFPGDP